MITKPLGVEFLFIKKIESTGEWGIYKANGKNGLLLFIYSQMDEAKEAAVEIAKLIRVEIKNPTNKISSIV